MQETEHTLAAASFSAFCFAKISSTESGPAILTREYVLRREFLERNTTRTNEINYTFCSVIAPSFIRKRSGKCVLVGYVTIQKTPAGSDRMTLERVLLYSFPQSPFFPENIRIFIFEATKMSKAIISPSVLAVSIDLRTPKDMDSVRETWS